ncbi:hypothetical protein GGI21_000490 [Coemansia aciculifera]|uniref:Uncharacterized protein n=1 Tax=Coemansia aciculifera TaxID=417176 RepID=A0ACC1MAU3_9FUNG|nr:hypothetical protein IWW38_000011 [Coemansia aciculifera]KAJ2910812.1 hypothetical protein GGI21_000490 [Coemansia aciculifera]
MSHAVSAEAKQTNVQQNPVVGAVNGANQVSGLTQLRERAGDKHALLFLHNSDTKPIAKFFDQCNEHLNSVCHADFGIAWCDYADYSTQFATEYKESELRLCLVRKNQDSKYIVATSEKNFVTIIRGALQDNIAHTQ